MADWQKEKVKMVLENKLTPINVQEFIREECGSFSISSPTNVNPDEYILTTEKYRETLIRQFYDPFLNSSN